MAQAAGDDAADRVAKARAFFARYVAMRGAVGDPRVTAAFAAIPREVFAGPGPWSISVVGPRLRGSTGPRHVQTLDDDPAILYQDVLIALDASRGINIGEPSLHAHCFDALAPAPGESVLQVGAGSGYYSAILAHLVGEGGRVHAFEIDAELGARAQCNLAHYTQVSVAVRSGAEGPLPEVDAIYVNAGLARPAAAWLDALRAGGRLLFPLQPEGGWGAMLLARKPADGGSRWPARFVCRASFIPCQAPADAGTGGGLAAAFAGGGLDGVASLCLRTSPDDTCWFRGRDWWLSTAPP